MPSGDSRTLLHIDLAAECIWRDGEKVGIPPKAFLVLCRLMERPGQLVTKNELLEAVWPNTFVTERVLNNAVGCLREALGDDRKRPRFIETVHRRGFRWIAPPAADAALRASPPPVVDEEDLGATEVDAFVGRAESLAALERCYARAAAGQRQLVLIGGEPGIGKTALVDRFTKGLGARGVGDKGQSFRARSAGILPAPAYEERPGMAAIRSTDSLTPNPIPPYLLARGQCVEAYGAGDLYRPLREAVEQLLRDGGEQPRAVFRSHAPSWLMSMPELSSPAERELLRRAVVVSTSDSVQCELERAIEAVSAERTIVLVLEDLHWSAPATVSLLWALAARREPARLMIVGTYRSADAIAQQHPITRLRRELSAKRQCVALDLDGLPADTVAAFLDRHLAPHRLPPSLADRLCGQTAGNPLFLLNALTDFKGRGWLRQENGVWQCTVDLDSIAAAVPESTRDLIAYRLDQLPPLAQELLEAASIAGDTFATQAVAAASERGCSQVETELEPLARAGFFLDKGEDVEWPDGTRGCEHTFRHALYRQVLMRRVTPTRRQLLHRKIALALESSYGDRVGEIAEALSRHHEQAGEAVRAVDYLDMLVQQAYARSAACEAEALLAHAVALLKRAPSSPGQQQRLFKVTIAHGIALSTVRGDGSVESLRAFEDARGLGQSLPISPESVASLGAIVFGKVLTGELREASALAEEMLAMSRSDDTSSNLVFAHGCAGAALLFRGELKAALPHLERAVAIVERGSSAAPDGLAIHPATVAQAGLAYALCLSGQLVRGRGVIESALRIARKMEMPWYLGFTLVSMANLVLQLHDLVEARRLATEALASGEQNAVLVGQDMSRVALACVEVLGARDPQLLEPLAEAAASIHTVQRSRVHAYLADACLVVGRIDAAEIALDAAFDARGEERLYDAELLRLRGMLLLARARQTGSQNTTDAEQVLEQAIEVAHAHGTRIFALRATVDLSRIWCSAGKHDQARQRLIEALGWFDEGFDETDLREAQALLDELEQGPGA